MNIGKIREQLRGVSPELPVMHYNDGGEPVWVEYAVVDRLTFRISGLKKSLLLCCGKSDEGIMSPATMTAGQLFDRLGEFNSRRTFWVETNDDNDDRMSEWKPVESVAVSSYELDDNIVVSVVELSAYI